MFAFTNLSLHVSEHLGLQVGLRCAVYRIDSSPTNSVTLFGRALPSIELILMTVEPIDAKRSGRRRPCINCAVNILITNTRSKFYRRLLWWTISRFSDMYKMSF